MTRSARGRAVVFIRRDGAPIGPFHFGHVGWAFLCDVDDGADATWACGSIENYDGAPFAPNDKSGFWHVDETSDPTAFMRAHRYNAYKAIDVAAPDPERARRIVTQEGDDSYIVIRSNCEDMTVHVLKAYGVADLPHRYDPRNWTPNGWYDHIDAPEFDTADAEGITGALHRPNPLVRAATRLRRRLTGESAAPESDLAIEAETETG